MLIREINENDFDGLVNYIPIFIIISLLKIMI